MSIEDDMFFGRFRFRMHKYVELKNVAFVHSGVDGRGRNGFCNVRRNDGEVFFLVLNEIKGCQDVFFCIGNQFLVEGVQSSCVEQKPFGDCLFPHFADLQCDGQCDEFAGVCLWGNHQRRFYVELVGREKRIIGQIPGVCHIIVKKPLNLFELVLRQTGVVSLW